MNLDEYAVQMIVTPKGLRIKSGHVNHKNKKEEPGGTVRSEAVNSINDAVYVNVRLLYKAF